MGYGYWRVGMTSSSRTYRERESQRGVSDDKNGVEADNTEEVRGHVIAPEDTWGGISDHGFWKRGTITMFDIFIVNLEAGSYLRMTPEKLLQG